jgi:hypothetical protein
MGCAKNLKMYKLKQIAQKHPSSTKEEKRKKDAAEKN